MTKQYTSPASSSSWSEEDGGGVSMESNVSVTTPRNSMRRPKRVSRGRSAPQSISSDRAASVSNLQRRSKAAFSPPFDVAIDDDGNPQAPRPSFPLHPQHLHHHPHPLTSSRSIKRKWYKRLDSPVFALLLFMNCFLCILVFASFRLHSLVTSHDDFIVDNNRFFGRHSQTAQLISYYSYTDPSSHIIAVAPLLAPAKRYPPQTIYYTPNPPSASSMNNNKYHAGRFVSDPLLKCSPGDESPVQPPYDPHIPENCVPMMEWQTQSRPTCNTMHEIDLLSGASKRDETKVTMLAKGWFRYALKIDHQQSNQQQQKQQSPPLVLKMLRYEREFLEEFYDLHNRDAMAMERLTPSPHIIDIYSFCAQSAINEYAQDSIERFAMKLRDDWSKTTFKLYLATTVARGVADIHTIDYDSNNATLVHYDLNPRNVAVFLEGRGGITTKINDFNVAEFVRWDPNKKQRCKFQGRLHEPWWRAPEEVLLPTKDTTKTNPEQDEEEEEEEDVDSSNNNNNQHLQQHTSTSNSGNLDEKADIYSLGNILYRILTGRAPRGKSIPSRIDKAREEVAMGLPPRLPVKYLESKDPAVVAIRRAMRRCYRKDPTDRWSARDIAEELQLALEPLLDRLEKEVKRFSSSSIHKI